MQTHWNNEGDRWPNYIPYDTSASRAGATGRLLSAQAAYFSLLDERSTGPLEAALGGDWQYELLRGLGWAFAKHQIHDVVAVHPTAQPIYLLPKLVREPELESPSGMDLCWRLVMESVSMNTMPLPTKLYPMPNTVGGFGQLHEPILEFLFEEALTFTLHSILAQALESAGEPTVHRTVGQALTDIVASEQQRGFSRSGLLANVGITNPSRSASTDRARGVALPHFPNDRLLLLHKGSSSLLGSIAWVPFVFQFMPVPAPCDTQVSGANGLAMSIRHKVVITNPDSICVAELRDWGPI